jgi:hypothetical protein
VMRRSRLQGAMEKHRHIFAKSRKDRKVTKKGKGNPSAKRQIDIVAH